MRRATVSASSGFRAIPLGGRRRPSVSSTTSKRSRSSARSIASGEVPMIGTPALLEGDGQPQRRLPAELHDHAVRPLHGDDLEHVLEGQRLEVEPVAGVVVRRDGLGVAVHHDRLDARLAQREGRVHAAVVELDALPDPVRPAAEDHDLAARRRSAPRTRPRRSSRGRACAPRTRRRRCPLACRPAARRARQRSARTLGLGELPEVREAAVREAELLRGAQPGCALLGARGAQRLLGVDDLVQVAQEPGVDPRAALHLLHGRAAPEHLGDRPGPPRARDVDLLPELLEPGLPLRAPRGARGPRGRSRASAAPSGSSP